MISYNVKAPRKFPHDSFFLVTQKYNEKVSFSINFHNLLFMKKIICRNTGMLFFGISLRGIEFLFAL